MPAASLSQEKNIKWEFSDYSVELEIEVLEVEKDKLIKFSWEAPGKATVVDMNFKVVSQDATELHITESNFEMNEDSVKHALQQTQGWTDFMCSLKAYLYTGINLRNGKMNLIFSYKLMNYNANSPEDYISQIPEERKKHFKKIELP